MSALSQLPASGSLLPLMTSSRLAVFGVVDAALHNVQSPVRITMRVWYESLTKLAMTQGHRCRCLVDANAAEVDEIHAMIGQSWGSYPDGCHV